MTMTALMAASQCGHVEVVRELLRNGAQVDVKLAATRWTALMLACLNNRVCCASTDTHSISTSRHSVNYPLGIGVLTQIA